MLNYLWAGMILIGIAYAAMTGQINEVSTAALDSSKEAVSLCITMIGVMSFWTGMMKIAKESGMLEAASEKIRPLLHFLFPGIPKGHPAEEHIATNIIANVLGLGWAATPAGLKAMEELKNISDRPPGIASNAMCNFLILNISSLQLIPINVIAYRSQYGSTDPADIILPGIIATCMSTLVAILYCVMQNRRVKK